MILTYCNLRTLNKNYQLVFSCNDYFFEYVPQKFSGVIFAESKSSEIHQGKTNGEGSKNPNHEQVDILDFICFLNSISTLIYPGLMICTRYSASEP